MTAPQPNAPIAHVFLLQLGGPKDLASIKPFLRNLFADVLPGPLWFRNLLGRLIAWRRTPKVLPLYAAIGGGSPLLPNTQAQADALAKRMAEAGLPVRAHVVMRYAPPRLPEALQAAEAEDPRLPWVLLPLYPHFSYATTQSGLREFSPALTEAQRRRLRIIDDYHLEPHYLSAMSDLIDKALAPLHGERDEDVHVVFSAHGLPLKLVNEGDPYPNQVRATVEALAARLPRPYAWTLCYQSRVGPVKWLTPSTQDTLKALGHKRAQHVVVVPVSFVSEHIETLQELDLELKDDALRAGVGHYHRVPTVGTHPHFIESLKVLVQQALSAQPASIPAGMCLCNPVRRGQRCLCAQAQGRA
jgi:ferrochelatase